MIEMSRTDLEMHILIEIITISFGGVGMAICLGWRGGLNPVLISVKTIAVQHFLEDLVALKTAAATVEATLKTAAAATVEATLKTAAAAEETSAATEGTGTGPAPTYSDTTWHHQKNVDRNLY